MSETVVEPAPGTLQLRLRQQALIADYGLFALGEDRLDAALQEACEIAARGLETRFAKVLTYRPQTQDLLLSHGVGWRDGVVGRVTLDTDLASPAGYALRTRLPVVSNHLGGEDRFRTPAVLAEHGIHRAINVLIDRGDGSPPFGVLEVDSTDRLDFTSHDTVFLQSLANLLAAAVLADARRAGQEALLREKDLLMQEVHHRVKNSLQLVQTMLQLQARGLPDDGERGRLQDAASRIMTIAAVHHRLYEAGAVDATDTAPYLRGLMRDIAASLAPDALRPIEVEADPVVLSPQRITPLGLIATELVTNALKYGAGRVRVRVTAQEGGMVVCVEDEGAGFPAGFDPAGGRSLGMRLVAALARTPDAIAIDRTVPFGRITVTVAFPPA